MKVTFKYRANVNVDGQIVVTIEAADMPPGYDLTIPPYTLTRAQSAQIAGAVCGLQGMVCAWCGKAPPLATDPEPG